MLKCGKAIVDIGLVELESDDDEVSEERNLDRNLNRSRSSWNSLL